MTQVAFPEPLDRILPAFVDDAQSTLGADLVGVYLYGSAVMAGFDPYLSDLDIIVVTARPTDEIAFASFEAIVMRVATREPAWADRLDIIFVGRATLADFRAGGAFVEISHDDPLARRPDASQYLESWFLMRVADTPLVGPAASTLVPPIDINEYLAVLVDDIDGFISRAAIDGPASKLAYRVITVCRVRRSLDIGQICTKREGVEWTLEHHPSWAALLAAAWDVRAAPGQRDLTPAERADARAFLEFMGSEIHRAASGSGGGR